MKPFVARAKLPGSYRKERDKPDETPIECSGMAWSGDRLIIVSDEHRSVIFEVPVDEKARSIGTVRERSVNMDLNDLEAITLAPSTGTRSSVAYAITSLSNNSSGEEKKSRKRIARFDVADAATPLPATVGSTIGLDAAVKELLDEQQVPLYREKGTVRGINVEALSCRGGDCLLGLRNPLKGEQALLIHVSPATLDSMAAGDETRPASTKPVWMSFRGYGIADLAWDARTNGYLVAAGANANDDDRRRGSALFWWDGRTETARELVRSNSHNLEGVARVGASNLVALCTDDEEPGGGRSSSLALMELSEP